MFILILNMMMVVELFVVIVNVEDLSLCKIMTEFHLYGVKRENSYGEFFTSIGLNIQHKYAWGVKDDDEIYDITFDISEDQSKHKPGIDYWGWMDYDKKRITMVWSNWIQFFACFPYGVEASEKSGQGKAYRLKIVNSELVK